MQDDKHVEIRLKGEGLREVVLAIDPETPFEVIVKRLEKTLTLDPDVFGPRGCDPCFSGVDRIVLMDPAFGRIR